MKLLFIIFLFSIGCCHSDDISFKTSKPSKNSLYTQGHDKGAFDFSDSICILINKLSSIKVLDLEFDSTSSFILKRGRIGKSVPYKNLKQKVSFHSNESRIYLPIFENFIIDTTINKFHRPLLHVDDKNVWFETSYRDTLFKFFFIVNNVVQTDSSDIISSMFGDKFDYSISKIITCEKEHLYYIKTFQSGSGVDPYISQLIISKKFGVIYLVIEGHSYRYVYRADVN